MKVWLINPYVHIPGEAWREGRSSHLARELSSRGHEVTLWTGNFSHHFKTFRSEGWKDIEVHPGYLIKLVPSSGYTKNISVGRLAYEDKFARRMFKRASVTEPPDVIVAHDPPQVNGHFGLRLARKHNVPLVVDTVDLWPEFFVRALPKALQPIGMIAAQPLFGWRKRNWRAAAGYTSLARPYLDLVQSIADPDRKKPAVVAYNGIDVDEFRSHLSGPELENIPAKKSGEIRAVFAGTLGPSYDIPAILGAARMAEQAAPQLTFVIAGDGPHRPVVQARADESKNVIYAGKLPVDQLARLYASCDIGLSAYGPFSNVEMPDKIYDYTAAGLVAVNSLVGEVKGFIEREDIGINYKAGDPDDLFRVLKRLVDDPSAVATYKANSWKVGKEFDNGRQIAGLADMIEVVATGNVLPKKQENQQRAVR